MVVIYMVLRIVENNCKKYNIIIMNKKNKIKKDVFDMNSYLKYYHNSTFDLFIAESQIKQAKFGVYTKNFIR